MSLQTRRLWLGVAALLIAAGVSLWPVTREVQEYAAPEPEPERVPPAQLSSATNHRTQPSAARLTAANSGDLRPHPITPEREALQQELRLVGALQDALDLQDVQALRSLVERYRAHVPGDENKLAEGYTRLADCLDSEDPHAAREAAAAYYENERASTLRRYIRRYCLER